MRMVDGVLLVVDVYEGPQAQTRFVLKKAMDAGLSPVIVINKVDRPNSQPEEIKEKVLELLLDLGADDDQFNSPVVYGSAKNGFFVRDLENDSRDNMEPLIETLIERVPAPEADPDQPFKMLVTNIDWDDYVGRVAIGKVLNGKVAKGDNMVLLRKDGTVVKSKAGKIFEYSKLGSYEAEAANAGNIVGIAGFEDVDIGETMAASEEEEALPVPPIDPPTVQMQFSINDGPFNGRDGKHVTSRAIRDRLFREVKTNISIEVSDTDEAGLFNVSARGVMQISVLVESMRREGYELLVSRPTVITIKDEDGVEKEPFETLYVEVPKEYVSPVIKAINERKGLIEGVEASNLGSTVTALVPTRGLIGFEIELMNLTSGHGVLSHLFREYAPYAGHIITRHTGTLVSMAQGTAMPYSLQALEERGKLFVEPQDEVYEGQVIGENPRREDLIVNPVKEKALTNHRAAGKDNNSGLAPATKFSLERAIEYIEADELVEATPNHLRIRKRILDGNQRKKLAKAAKEKDK